MTAPAETRAYTLTVVSLQRPMPVSRLNQPKASVSKLAAEWERHGPQVRTIDVAYGEQVLSPQETGLRRILITRLADATSSGSITVEGGITTPLVPTAESIELTGRRWKWLGPQVVWGLVIPQTEGHDAPEPDDTREAIWPVTTIPLGTVLAGLDLASL